MAKAKQPVVEEVKSVEQDKLLQDVNMAAYTTFPKVGEVVKG